MATITGAFGMDGRSAGTRRVTPPFSTEARFYRAIVDAGGEHSIVLGPELVVGLHGATVVALEPLRIFLGSKAEQARKAPVPRHFVLIAATVLSNGRMAAKVHRAVLHVIGGGGIDPLSRVEVRHLDSDDVVSTLLKPEAAAGAADIFGLAACEVNAIERFRVHGTVAHVARLGVLGLIVNEGAYGRYQDQRGHSLKNSLLHEITPSVDEDRRHSHRSARNRATASLPVRLELHELPRSVHDRLTDTFWCCAGFGHLRGKENFLEANRSPGAMVARPTVQETPVTEAIAVAIARLLREDLRYVVRDRVSPRHDGMVVAR